MEIAFGTFCPIIRTTSIQLNATFKNFHWKMWHHLFISILFLFHFTNGQVGQSFGPKPVYVDNSNSQQGKIIKIRI